MLNARSTIEIPEETQRIARAAYPKGNTLISMRDEMGPIFEDEMFAELYSGTGQPAISPARLALVTLMQYMENLTDRQAAEAVRGRIDWKYALGLELEDAGFHYSVLSEFRGRLVGGGQESLLLNALLARCEEKGLLKGKRMQRTDSTHILSAVRGLNLTELVGETMRYVLNEIASTNPEWLTPRIQPDWGKRYSKPLDALRLPKGKNKQIELAVSIGQDGYHLLQEVYASDMPELITLQSVEVLRRIWVQQFYIESGQVYWRTKKNLGQPPAHLMLSSPFDLEARYCSKRSTSWIGYKVHLTETCDPEHPRLFTQVESTLATTHDVHLTQPIQENLQDRGLAPEIHIVDGGYIEDDLLVSSARRKIDLVGPAPANKTWQAKDEQAFDHSHFEIDWAQKVATCPAGNHSDRWSKRHTRRGTLNWVIAFNSATCRDCALRSRCTTATRSGRSLTIYPPDEYHALAQARQRQNTEAYQQIYDRRAGIEGSISQAVRSTGMRRSRYHGLAKSHLQHLASAAAINILRSVAWLCGERPADTPLSSFAALAQTLVA